MDLVTDVEEFILDGSRECFKNIFLKYVTVNSAKGIDNINFESYKSRLDENSELIFKKIHNGDYKFSYYSEKLILKGRKKEPRIISIPTIRDKVVLKYIQLKLKKIYFDIEQKLPQFHIKEFKDYVVNYNYLIKMDIEKYYDSIDHNILENILKLKYIDSRTIELISRAISRPTINKYELSNKKTKKVKNSKGTPQGLAISNILAAIYIKEIDDIFNNRNNIKYIRYVDDIMIFCDEKDALFLEQEIEENLKVKLKLDLNNGKTYKNKIDESVNVSFLGYNYRKVHEKFNGFSIKNENLFKFENSIVNVFTRFSNDEKMSKEQFIFILNNKITGSISKKVDTDASRESKYGWLFFYSQIDDYTIPYRLDNLVDMLIKRFPKCSNIDLDKVKSFKKALNEIRYNINETTYIHRPDVLDNEERKDLLINVFKIQSSKLNDKNTIDKLYYRLIYKPIKLLQKDIQQIVS
ncbi:reverse transcriptase domain-containing protein [Clostridium gasigenes]|uniref:reverse transcriptase domain-containing protein n=1 Tax=Clostridium gasigenes TaxID=94869 RepID=UPI001C0CBC5A|nr:reverse transcriptase domain-containing protein [Clostridium gasigenes]MBU3105146.1 reverse transcriptase/maturase family protein [Clostridium gasigenes]